jgi:hypothetical protein
MGRIILRGFLVLSHTLFLWMYLSAEPLESMARQAGFAGAAGPDVITIADRYAALWRHGMAGNAWLYLPGFFAAAAFTWMWALGRRLRTLVFEGIVLLAVATAAAALLAPRGTILALASFEQATGLHATSGAPGFSLRGVALAVYTIVTWDIGVLCCQRSIARRSVRPMWIPIPLNIVLANVRPWTVSDFTSQWIAGVAAGRAVAVLSASAIPLLSVFLVLHQLRNERRLRRSSSAAEPPPACSTQYEAEAGERGHRMAARGD